MADELRFVQFPHPGPEHQPNREGWKDWNIGDHARKFMRSPGRWRDSLDAPERQGPVVFWGEWEAPSRVLATYPGARRGWPRYLFEPVWHVSPRTGFIQNTDPYVFGEWFRYSNCRQNGRNRSPRSSQRLSEGSLILFGSKFARGFVVDTVMVVGDAQHMNPHNVDELEGIDPAFRAVVCDPLYRGEATSPTNRLYRGATPDEPVGGMFSFVPCVPAEEAQPGFPRPEVRLPNLINPNLAMNYKMTPVENFDRMRAIWGAVVDQIADQGLGLCTHLATPTQLAEGESSEAGPQTRC